MLKAALLIIALALGALIVGLLTYDAPAWLLEVQLGPLQLSINSGVLTAALLMLAGLLMLLFKLLRLPFQMLQALRGRKDARAAAELNRGLLLYLKGLPDAARKPLLHAAEHPAFKQSANLLAARCAIQQNRLSDADKALQAARRAGCDSFPLMLAQAELLIAEEKHLQARSLLEELALAHTGNIRIAQLLEQTAAAAGDAATDGGDDL